MFYQVERHASQLPHVHLFLPSMRGWGRAQDKGNECQDKANLILMGVL
jgi:hypothetical protein